MLCLLVGTGVYLTIILGMPQLRYFFLSLKEVFGRKKAVQRTEGDKSISSFAALATAMAVTVGTSNIADVATALHLGGPGALFWMLVSAFFGMCTVTAKDKMDAWLSGPNGSKIEIKIGRAHV